MRVFLLSVLTAVAVAGLVGVTLTTHNESVADANASAQSVRLNDQEAVNWYGRELVPDLIQPQS